MQACFSFHCAQNANVLSLCHSYLCSSNHTAAALTYQGLENPSPVWQLRTPGACANISAQQTMLSKAPGAKFPARLPAPSTNGS